MFKKPPCIGYHHWLYTHQNWLYTHQNWLYTHQTWLYTTNTINQIITGYIPIPIDCIPMVNPIT